MRLLSVVAAALLLASAAAHADCPARPDEGNLARHDCYLNRDGREVHRPSPTNNGAPPVSPTAQCRDGTWSFSQHRSGACSHHGGIAR